MGFLDSESGKRRLLSLGDTASGYGQDGTAVTESPRHLLVDRSL